MRVKKIESKELFISVIVPALNEAQLIQSFLEQLHETLAQLTSRIEIIVVDDGSTDHCIDLVKQVSKTLPVKLVAFSRNFGKEHAITAGLDYCTGDVAIIMDADFQHPFTSIADFVNKWGKGYDMVYGVRRDRGDQPPVKRFFSSMFYRLMNWMSDIKIPPHAGDFRLLDRALIDTLKKCPEQSRFMKGLYAWAGFKAIAVAFDVNERPIGKSRWSFKKLIALAFSGFLSFSDVPLRMWSFIGLIIALIAFCYGLWIVFYTLFFGADVPGYATLLVSIMFLGGIQLLSIGILGEYIARIFKEVKKRPNYVVGETVGLKIKD